MQRRRMTRQEKQEQTRQRLLDTAVEIFLEKGFARASVEEIAERAGYSKGAMYSNFSSKDELVLAVLDRRIDQQLEILADLIPTQGNDPSFWFNEGESGSQGPWEPLLIELWVRALYDEKLRERVVEQRERVLEASARILSGGATPNQQHRDAVIITSALSSGLAMQFALDPDPHLMELFADVVVQLFKELNPPTS